ncbi:MAG TPA: AEC family transporter [Solirubrobacterales bacterium]|nr:AEC family transporter [Solirubrobacterales bacterium]
MLPIVAAIVASTAAGVWAEHRYRGRAGLAARRSMLAVLYLVFPPVVFFNIARAEVSLDAGAGIGLAFVSLGLLAATAWIVARRLLRLRRPGVGSFVNAAIAPNTGYLGYPVVAALLGFDALSEAAAYDVLVSSPVLLLGVFAVGAAFGERAGEGVRERALAFVTRNPPLYAAIAGLLAPDALAPDVLVDASRIAIMAVLPLGFFAVGAVLAEEAVDGRIGFPPPLDAPVASVVALRLVAGPALLFALAAPLIDLPNTYLLLAAMPTGLNTIIVAHAYGLDLRIAAGAIAWSTAIAVVVLAVAAAFT